MYDVVIYKPNGRQGPTIRGLTYTQMNALVNGLGHHNIKPMVKTIQKEEEIKQDGEKTL